MARPKEYVREAVLDAATQVFWEKGYEGTSVSDLVEGTGLHRRSMYEEFGDKDGFFLACLDHFAYETTKDLARLLHKTPLGLRNIEVFFHDRVEYACSRKFKGCLLVKSAVEQELLTEDARKKVQHFQAQTEKAFYDCLRAAQTSSEMSRKKDCAMLAKYLFCFLEGLMVMGQSPATKKELESIVETALSIVKE